MRALKDCKRSCARGVGASSRPRPLPLELLGQLPAGREAWCEEGPLNPRAAMIMGSWWLCREVEISSSRARLIELLFSDAGVPSVRWHLPASKNDTLAMGMGRSLNCCCSTVGRAGCPAHCLWDHLLFLKHSFPEKFVHDVPNWDLPLFPKLDGGVVPKSAMVKTIVTAATFLSVPLEAPDGSERVSGHSLRVSGAQGLARMGWDLWAIQLHGRWQSDVVKHYVREAHLGPVGPTSGRVDPSTLEYLVECISQKLACGTRVGPEDLPTMQAPAAPKPEELHHLVSAEQPTGAEEPELTLEQLVLHTGSGIYHRRTGQSSIRTVCGWGYAESALAVEVPDRGAGPQGWFQLCSRCWPRARMQARGLSEPMALCTS